MDPLKDILAKHGINISVHIDRLPSEFLDDDFALENPPRGVRYEKTENGVIVRAMTHSWGALIVVPFMCVWTVLSMGGIYGSQIYQREFMPLLSLIGIPFTLFTLFFWWYALMLVCGKVEIRLNGDDGRVYTGVASIGRTRRFKLSEMMAVKEYKYWSEVNGKIVIEGRKRITFGSLLSGNRRHFMAQVLHRLLHNRKIPA